MPLRASCESRCFALANTSRSGAGKYAVVVGSDGCCGAAASHSLALLSGGPVGILLQSDKVCSCACDSRHNDSHYENSQGVHAEGPLPVSSSVPKENMDGTQIPTNSPSSR